ncbi:MAG: glycosyltransferase, partial [Solirubrobacteraceae bacterium]
GQAHELADDGVGLSFFNLHGRSIVAHEQSILVDGSPLRLMRLPGFDPADPLALSIAQNRIRADEQPPVAELCRKYAAMLYDAGEAEASRVPYGFARLPDGTRVGHWMHEICRQASKAGVLRRSPFTRWGMEELYGWLRAPASTGAESGINRLCLLMCDLHPGLRDAYPDLDDLGQARGLIEWLYRHGVSEGTLPLAAVPPTTHARLEEERRRQLFELNFGVNVVGYLTSELGIGEGARLIVSALDAAAVPLLPLTPPTPPQSRNQHAYTALPTSAAGFPLNLICVNVDGLQRFQQEVGRGFFEHRHNIGLWWWEVDVLPPEWRGAFELLDEVWVGTEHVARALTAVSPIPVHRIRMPIVAPRAEPMPREALGLDDERMFLSMFDHRSVVERKNPLGTIAAFAEAFAPDSGAVLVLKSVNAELDPTGRERVRAAAAPHPHVRLVEGYLSPAQTHGLIAACDCFVSLHRAEGFGLGPAEAMSLAKPVIATGYSGNLDFMTTANSYLVQYTLSKVGPGCWPYPAEANWAEVDLDHAARLMREVFEDPAGAGEVGARAAADLSRTHSAAVAGAAMRSRIEEIAGGLALEPFLPVPDPAVNLTIGRRGRLLRRFVPGITAKLEHELELLRAASERQRFDLYAAMRGPMLNAQASTLATLRRLEQRAPTELAEPDHSPRAARLYRQRR